MRSRKSLLVLAALTTGAAVVALAVPGSAGAVQSTTVQVPQRLCATAKHNRMSCDAMRLVTKRVTTTQAQKLAAAGLARLAVSTPKARLGQASAPNIAFGPAGGYSPAQLAKAYGVDANAATTQTVAIVDAYKDPSVLADLNAFNSQYGLPLETTTSFKVVNQTGSTDLSAVHTDVGWAGEITLDVEAVRGLCHKCKILLVEANSNHSNDLGIAVNYAAAHAKIVSNSYGGTETDVENTPAIETEYNHPGVAILASTGDDGWYAWDHANVGCPGSCTGQSDNVPSVPASYNTVIGVGGTMLNLNPDSTRAAEAVWNENGPFGIWGFELGTELGASGGGCSTKYAPKHWQQSVAGYGSLGCGSSLRNGVDVAAVADPFFGFDTYETTTTWCTPGGTDGNGNNCPNANPGFSTIGGTSLASPVIAALWALAGGPAGVTYPSLTLYGHYKSDRTHLYDVTVGSNGLCGGVSPVSCTGDGSNPNEFGQGLLDCAWGSAGNTVLANHYQCYARPGYDGVSGVGTPKGVNPFRPLSPIANIKAPGTVTHGVAHTFSAQGSSSPFPGGTITKYVWHWGDGTTTTTSSVSVSHKYATKGSRTITLDVTDNYSSLNNNRTGHKAITISVG